MAIGAGIGAQLGIVTEVTFNTYLAVSRFYEFTSESIQYNKKTAVGMGLRAGGQLPRAQRRVVTSYDAGGDITLDLPTRGLGLLLSHAMGSAPTPTTVSTGVYSYSFTLGDVYGRSFSAQVGVPQYNGTVMAKTVTGVKVQSFELAVANNGIATGKFTVDAAGFVTSQALATASYSAAGSVFNFSQGSLTVDAVAVANVKDFSLTIDNSLKQDRFTLNGLATKSEQTISGFRKVSGKLTAEFTDVTLMNKFLTDTSAALVLSFVGSTIAATYKDTLTITLPAVKFNADTPNVAGPGVVDLAMTFDVFDDGTNPPVTIFYQTADAAL